LRWILKLLGKEIKIPEVLPCESYHGLCRGNCREEGREANRRRWGMTEEEQDKAIKELQEEIQKLKDWINEIQFGGGEE